MIEIQILSFNFEALNIKRIKFQRVDESGMKMPSLQIKEAPILCYTSRIFA